MATMRDVLIVLNAFQARGQKTDASGVLSGMVAKALWPDRRFERSPWGGPDGGQRAAAGLLGRLNAQGLVGKRSRPNDPRTWWYLTSAGRDALRSNAG